MIRITITKWRVSGYHLGDDIIETGKAKLADHQESLSVLNVDPDELSEKKAEFIEKIATQVVAHNRDQERDFKKKGLGSFTRLIISDITHK